MKITELFQNREFVVSAEVGPPKGIHIDGMVEEAKKYLTGVHFVNVTDNQSSVMRLGSLATCKVLKDAGLSPIFQLTCRDRNRIALQSDLLSAAMLGIDNILCLTGDHTKLGDHPQAKPVFDLDSVSLLYAASMLETGKDLGGNELVGEAPKFAKGAVVSPWTRSWSRWSARSRLVPSTSRRRLCLSPKSLSSLWRLPSSSASPCRSASSSRSLLVCASS